MKTRKRITSIITVLVLVACMLPVGAMTAKADPEAVFEITLDTYSVNEDFSELVPGSTGSLEYDNDTKTLTITDANVTTIRDYFIKVDISDDVTINCVGDNVINMTDNTHDCFGIFRSGSDPANLTITGSGYLEINVPEATASRHFEGITYKNVTISGPHV